MMQSQIQCVYSMAEFKKYGRARLIWGKRIARIFPGSIEAIEWHNKMTKGLRRHFVDACMIYNDAECTDKMLQEFDMYRFIVDSEDYSFHDAYEWANQHKYGGEDVMPELLIKPKDE